MTIISRIWNRVSNKIYGLTFPNIHKNAKIHRGAFVYNHKNLIMEDKTNISGGTVIMNTRAKFIMKKNAGAAFGMAVITGNHMVVPGMFLKDVSNKIKDELDIRHEYDKDIVVEEDVWIGAKAVLLSGVTLGRGCIIGAGSVVRNNIPPYSIAIGNPARVVAFKFPPSVIAEHEEMLLPEEERLPLQLLEDNYKKYFLDRIDEIRRMTE